VSGPINDRHTPADLPNNEWTQMIERIHARNQGGGAVPGEIAVGVPMMGTPLPTVRSAELGRVLPADDPNRPLRADEIEELNQQALASGLVVGPVNPSIARTLGASGEDDAPYASMEEAIAAGAPVGADAAAVAEGAMRFREPSPSTPIVPVRRPIPRPTAGAASVTHETRLPDFKRVQMIDLVNGKVWVDEMEFAIGPTDVKMLRKFCVTIAKDQVQAALDAAMKALAEDADAEGESA
jgi:hypothetical protein